MRPMDECIFEILREKHADSYEFVKSADYNLKHHHHIISVFFLLLGMEENINLELGRLRILALWEKKKQQQTRVISWTKMH